MPSKEYDQGRRLYFDKKKHTKQECEEKKRSPFFFFFVRLFIFFLVSHGRYEIDREKRMPYIMRGVGGVILFPLFLFLS